VNPKPISTVPDDVFYVLKLILTRMLSSGDIDFIKLGISSVKTSMEKLFVEIYKQKLDHVYIQDTHSSTRVDKSERENRVNFIVRLLSNIYAAVKLTLKRYN